VRISRSFFERSAVIVARELVGCSLFTDVAGSRCGGTIVEAEAYVGPGDRASHSFGNRRTPRTEVQFGPRGLLYVYRIYGLHSCVCVVSGVPNAPEVVLIRAFKPTAGELVMVERRGGPAHCTSAVDIASGPGRVCSALGISQEWYGLDLCSEERIWIEAATPLGKVIAAARVNIDYAAEDALRPWRFLLQDDRFVSRPRRPAQ